MVDFYVIIGDWSGDGHNERTKFQVRIPDHITPQMLADNYAKVKQTVGFGYEEIAEEYDDSLIHAWHCEQLTKLGLRIVQYRNAYADGGDIPFDVIPVDADSGEEIPAGGQELTLEDLQGDYENYSWTISFGSGESHAFTYLKIMMTMVGYGLDGWEWEVVPSPDLIVLSGAYKAPLPSGGYGLYRAY